MLNADRARILLRVTVACLLAAHGWFRLVTGGHVGFGEWLSSQHVPFGPAVAILVTAIEVLATPLLAIGRYVRVVAPLLAAVYVCGMLLLHRNEGWFVVGGGRNGMEYSVLLVVCLGVLWLTHDQKA